MNEGLKTVLNVLFKSFVLGKDLVQKAGVAEDMRALQELIVVVPPAVNHFSSLESDVSSLADPEHVADLLAFISSHFAELNSDEKAQAILSASLKMIVNLSTDCKALAKAIKG